MPRDLWRRIDVTRRLSDSSGLMRSAWRLQSVDCDETGGTDRGRLTLTSVTELDKENRRLLLSERHTLTDEGHERSSDYQFVMRCWTRDELDASFTRSGFRKVGYFGAYDAAADVGATDRLVAVAQLLKVDVGHGGDGRSSPGVAQ